MREIKFRAWSKKHKQMIEHNNLILENSEWIGMVCIDGRPIDGPCDDNVDLMQYTGMKDKNGAEIYEGDVIKATDGNNNHIFQIKWIDHDARFSFIDSNGVFPFWKIWQFNPEVIGNIHQNPELIK